MKSIMLNNGLYKVLTPSGFQAFDGIIQTDHTKYLAITIGNDTLKCSLNHIIVNGNDQLLASDIKSGDIINGKIVSKCELIEDNIKMYDLVNVANGHLYFTNNIISHNCDCDFLTSGRPVVHGTILDWYQKESGYITEPLAKQGFDGNYWAWAFPDYSKQYMITADVARGDGSDYSAFHVFDLENMEQVAEYRGKIDTKNYGIMLAVAGTEWNDALVVVENANVGWAVIQQIIERGYKNLFYSYKDDGYIDPSIHLVKGYDLKSKEQMVPGFTTSSRTRPLLISKLDMVMREKLPIIRSQRLIDELFTFVWNGTRAEARSGYNDDLIMSFCIGWYLRDTALRLKQQGTELTKNTLMNIRRSTGTAFRTGTSQAHNQWNWQVGGSDENLKWLLK